MFSTWALVSLGVVTLLAVGGPTLLIMKAVRKAKEDAAREIELKKDPAGEIVIVPEGRRHSGEGEVDADRY